jgi:hypothetical protein
VTLRDPTQAYNYVAYGLCLSSNLPVVGLLPSSSIGLPDVQIRLGDLPNASSSNRFAAKLRYASALRAQTGQPELQIWDVDDGEFLRLQYSDGVVFWLDRTFTTLWAHWPTGSSLQDASSYLVGPILGLLLRLRGIVCLHASAVSINDRAVVFVGSEGAGKSTTAAAFARRGCGVLSDDIVPLIECGDGFQTVPACPRINLWPDSAALLYGSPDALPSISLDWDKRCLSLGKAEGAQFEERPLPLGAIYVLGESAGGPEKGVEIISQKAALMMLVGNTYATNFLDAKQRAEEFEVLSRVVATVPVRKINRRREAAEVDGFCAAIQRDFAGVESRANSLDQ